MQTGRRFRLYPAQEQGQTLLRWIGRYRHIYNKVREERHFHTFAHKLFSLDCRRGQIDHKYAHFIGEGTEWLRLVLSVVLRNGAVLWKQVCARFFKGLAGRPSAHIRYVKQSVWLKNELFRFVALTAESGKVSGHRLVTGARKHPVVVMPPVAHRDYRIPAWIPIAIDAGKRFALFSDDNSPEIKPEETSVWLASFRGTN